MEIAHDMPAGAPIINIEGKKGGSLFYRPVIWFIQEDFKRIKEQYEGYQKLIEGAKEERLLTLIGALSMEEALDLFLRAYIPDYHRLEKQRDFTLFIKIELARSLRIIPTHILDAAALINNVRNKFAHELKIERFDSLDIGTQDNLKQKDRVFFPDDNINTSLTVKDMFIHIVEAVIIGLGIYSSHLRTAKEYIYSAEFSQQLVERIKAKSG